MTSGADQRAALTVEQLIALGRVQGLAPSPCGTWLAVEVAKVDHKGAAYRSDIWKVFVDGDAAPVRLTRGPFRHSSPCFRRDGSLGFLSNRGTSEAEAGKEKRSQVWLLPPTGEASPITDEPLGVTSFCFARRGNRLVVRAPMLPDVPFDKQREVGDDRTANGPSALHYTTSPVRYWDHWLPNKHTHLLCFDEEGGDRKDLTPTPGLSYHIHPEWSLSEDGRWLASTYRQSLDPDDRIPDIYIQIFDLEEGSVRVLGERPKAHWEELSFSPDGTQLACVRTDRFADKCFEPTLAIWSLADDTYRDVPLSIDRHIHPVYWRQDASELLCFYDEKGQTPFGAVDIETGQVTRLVSRDAGGSHSHLALLPDGRIAGIKSSFFHPPEPFVAAWEPDGTPELRACLSGFSADEGRAIASCVSFVTSGHEGADVQSFLLAPADAEASTPLPLVLWIHGGPRSQWRDGWHWRWNALVPVSAGYAVACPNPRGSTGEGHPFMAEIWGNQWGAACYEDVMAVTKALQSGSIPECKVTIDGERMAAMGGSFGGYMTNWIGTQNDTFRCLITHAALFSLSQFYGSTDMAGWLVTEFQADPYNEAFDRYSPHRFIDNWKTPTLVIHGEKDYRVPISEALFLFESLQVRGVPSELLVFPDENHWILKPRNIKVWYDKVMVFLDRYLKG